jgi:hypothetical protein
MKASTNEKNLTKLELQENKNKYLKLKTAQILKILNLQNSDINSNYQFKPFDSGNANEEDKILENYLYDKNNNISAELNEYKVINPYNKSKTLSFDNGNLKNSLNLINSNSKDKIEVQKLDDKMQFANEVKLTKKKLGQSIPQGSIVHCLTLLKDNEGNYTNKFVTGLDNGKINVYYFDKKRNTIYLDYEVNEHTKAITYLTSLKGGRILSCSLDNTIKLIEETVAYSYLLSFWKRYYVIQTMTKPEVDKYKQFQPTCAIEMSVNTLVSGDWNNLTLWKLIKKTDKKPKKKIKNFAFDLMDYNKYKYGYYYEIYKEIGVTTSVTSLLNIDNKTFVSAHYGPSTITFYNIYDDSRKTLDKIRCVDSANQCMTLIEVQNPLNSSREKIIVVGGYKCIYLISVKNQTLIDKISLPQNDYIKCAINSGIHYISNGFICAGLFNQSSYNLVHYNAKSQLGFSELVVNEVSQIKDTGKSAINYLLIFKKNVKDDSCNQKNMVIITAGNDQNVCSYLEKEENDEEEDDDEFEEIIKE